MSLGSAISVAGVEDFQTVVQFFESVTDAPHWDAAVWRRVLDRGSESSQQQRMVLLDEPVGGVCVGLAVASYTAGVGELEAVVVAPANRRLGRGRALCVALMRWAAAQGATEMQLEVRASNVGAIGLYRKLGFTEVGRRPRYYREPQEDAVLMTALIGTGESSSDDALPGSAQI